MKGSTAYKKITEKLAVAQNEQAQAQADFEQAKKSYQKCADRLRAAITTIVQHRLDNTGTLSALAGADRKCSQLAKQRSAKIETLERALDENAKILERADTTLAEKRFLRDEAVTAWNNSRAGAIEGLRAENPDIVEREARVAGYNEQISKIEMLAASRENICKDFQAKLDSDSVFAYCKRQNPNANPLVRWMDGMVKNVSGYAAHTSAFEQAQSEALALRNEQDRMRKLQAVEQELLSETLDAELAKPEYMRVLKAMETSKVELAEAGAARDLAADSFEYVTQQHEMYTQRRDGETHQQQEILFKALMDARDTLLIKAAKETKTQEDDKAVQSIIEDRRHLSAYMDEVEHCETELKNASKTVTRVRKIHDDFKSRGYNRSDSRLRSSVDMDALLLGVILGNISTEKAWSTISSGHHRVDTSSSSSSGGWGGSSGGGFGGGGFSSGGGFGGGGGFSTGGGF